MKYIYLLCISLAISCNSNNNYSMLYNQLPLKNFIDDDELNKNTDDNTIYKPYNKITYNYIYKHNNQPFRFGVKFNNNCLKDNKINCIDYFDFPLDSMNLYRNNAIDYLTMTVFNTKGHTSLANNQTIIKYDYINNINGPILQGERTGIVENSEKIFLHPPRSYSFSLLQLTAFPYLKLPLSNHLQWTAFNSIPYETLKHSGINHQTDLNLNFEYNVVEEINHKSELGTLKCWKINAISESEGYKVHSTYLFNNTYGFIQMEHNINNTHYYLLKLTNIK